MGVGSWRTNWVIWSSVIMGAIMRGFSSPTAAAPTSPWALRAAEAKVLFQQWKDRQLRAKDPHGRAARFSR